MTAFLKLDNYQSEEYTQNDRTKRRCPGATEVIIVVGGKYRVGALDNVEKLVFC